MSVDSEHVATRGEFAISGLEGNWVMPILETSFMIVNEVNLAPRVYTPKNLHDMLLNLGVAMVEVPALASPTASVYDLFFLQHCIARVTLTVEQLQAATQQ